MKPAIDSVTFGALLILWLAQAGAAPAPAPIPAPEKTSAAKPPTPGEVSGTSLYGVYLMHYTVNADGSAVAHFNPPLAADNALLIGAMKSLARIAYGQNGVEVKDVDAFKPSFGKIITLSDLDYEYRFILEGTQGKGVGVIAVRRQEVKHPSPIAIPSPGSGTSANQGPVSQVPIQTPVPVKAPQPH